ncbi:MAG: ferrous iron transport protein A [Thaumarchaeota archaeon]|nr:ferrous iron transport protein A [Nitrososphaerota archaeon]
MARKPLSELKPGQVGVIVDIVGGSPRLRRRILDMGLVKGTRIKVVRVAPLKDPIELQTSGYDLTLRRDEAKNIIVEVVE